MSTPTTTADSIEFHCTGCGRTLKVPASAAGRRASCPQCNTVVQVPARQLDASERDTHKPEAQARDLPAPPSVAWALPPQPPAAPPPPQPQASPAGTPPVSPLPGAHLPPPGTFRPQPMASPSAPALRPQIEPGRETPTKKLFDRITAEIAKIYVGQDELVLGALVALFSSGHVLIESVPGLGKTLFVRTLGRVLGLKFGRIQFTADLMPSDVTGAPILDMKSQEFRFRPGPVFTQLLLADEINRAPAKTHAALLEIMQEYRVTVDGKSHAIERPFLVLATQNPIESEGTYNLPEAQLDRFMFKLIVEYPSTEEEADILRMHSCQTDIDKRLAEELQTVTTPDEIVAVTEACSKIHVDDKLIDYINRVVRATRGWPQFHMGASPRAGIAL